MESPQQHPSEPILNIVGSQVALGPPRRDLLAIYLKWINDFEVTRTLAIGMRPTSWESEEAWYERICTSERDAFFTIYERSSLRPIGGTGLHNIDPYNRTAEFGILIGEKDCWGRGYGTETTSLVLDFGFTALGLHNIMLRVYSFNERGLRAYARAGFRVIGRRRESHRFAGRAYDEIYMDSLASEFLSPVLHHLRPDS